MDNKVKMILLIILFLSVITGCTNEEQITKLVNDYVEAYNVRDTTACLNLYYVTSAEEENEKDPDNSGSLQYYFDVYPTTPTYTVRIYENIDYWGTISNVFVEQKNSEEDEWESAAFALVKTGGGFLGFFSEWLIIMAPLDGSPPFYLFKD